MVHLWCNIQQQTLFCISLSWSIMDEHYNMWSFTKLWDIYCMKYQWHQDSLALSRCVAGWNCNQSVKTHCCNFRNTLVAQAYWRIRNQFPNGISETFLYLQKNCREWVGQGHFSHSTENGMASHMAGVVRVIWLSTVSGIIKWWLTWCNVMLLVMSSSIKTKC